MNYWKQFAEMLGLELGQEFEITDNGKRKDEYTYKITKDGFWYKSTKDGDYLIGLASTIYGLLNGYFEAVPKPWKPKEGDRYYYYSASNGLVNYAKWDGLCDELLLWKVGNCFRTEEEARTKGKEIMEQIQKEFEEGN